MKYLNATAGFAGLMGWELPADWENVTSDYYQRARGYQTHNFLGIHEEVPVPQGLSRKIAGVCSTFQPIKAFQAANGSLIMDALKTELPDYSQACLHTVDAQH